MFSFFKKSKPTPAPIPASMRGYRYTCSCGEHTDLEWCPKCGIRNTYKWNGSKGNPPRSARTSSSTSSSSDDTMLIMSSYTPSYSSDSCSSSSYSSSDSSSSSDSGSCSSGD